MNDPKDLSNLFKDIHHGLPRQGPGSRETTLKALSSCTDLPEAVQVLDVGCGPGAQSIVLAEALPKAHITAIDLYPFFLEELEERAAEKGLSERIETKQMNMLKMPFEAESFDLIWAEGSAYIMGFLNAVRDWHKLLKPGGYLAVSEICWLQEERSKPLVDFWKQAYNSMRDLDSLIQEISKFDYKMLEYFVLPNSAWWDEYYTPLSERLPGLVAKYGDNPTASAIVMENNTEIEMRRQYPNEYGYAFFVLQKAGA